MEFKEGDVVYNANTKQTAVVVGQSAETVGGIVVNVLTKDKTIRTIWNRKNMVLKAYPPSVKTLNFDIEKEKIRITSKARQRRVRILKLK